MHAVQEFRRVVTDQLALLESELLVVTPRPTSGGIEQQASTPRLVPQRIGASIDQKNKPFQSSYTAAASEALEIHSVTTPKTPRLQNPRTPRGVACSSLNERPSVLVPRKPSDMDEELEVEVNVNVDRWLEFVEAFLMRRSLRNLECNWSENEYHLRNAWTVNVKPTKSTGKKASTARVVSEVNVNAISVAATERRSSYIATNACVRHPDKTLNLMYMLIGSALVLYDFTSFPLILAFDLQGNSFTQAMAWFAASYWTIDIAMSCSVGYYTKTGIEMGFTQILRNYVRTWLIFDASVVTLDWVFLVFAVLDTKNVDGTGVSAILRFNRYIRVARFLRCVRVVRIAQTVGEMATRYSDASSELRGVVARLLLLIFTMLLVNHYVACAWFAIGFWNHDDKRTWLTMQHAQSESVGMWYAMSFHWSITQFTPATNNIAPVNVRERVFASMIVLFALVMFSNFLSSLTNALAEIRKINIEAYTEESRIRDFLQARNVSVGIRNRTWYFYRKHYRMRKPLRHEADIDFMQDLPRSIKSDLYKEIYAPALMEYSILEFIGTADWLMLMGVCTHALSEKSYMGGQEIFAKGEVATAMLFCIQGVVSYTFEPVFSDEKLEAPCYICETTLWCQCLHLGLLTAETHCEMLLISGSEFADIMSHNLFSIPELLRNLQRYAQLYMQYIIDHSDDPLPVNDISNGHDERLARLLERCFSRGGGRRARGTVSHNTVSDHQFWHAAHGIGQMIKRKTDAPE